MSADSMTDYVLEQLQREEMTLADLETMVRLVRSAGTQLTGTVAESLRQLERERLIEQIDGRWQAKRNAERVKPGRLF